MSRYDLALHLALDRGWQVRLRNIVMMIRDFANSRSMHASYGATVDFLFVLNGQQSNSDACVQPGSILLPVLTGLPFTFTSSCRSDWPTQRFTEIQGLLC